MADSLPSYIHGVTPEEQSRLKLLNDLTNQSFIEFLKLRGTERVLELGSGLGLLCAKVATILFRGHATGIELSKAQLSKTPQSPSNLEFVLGDVHELPFRDKSFDLVYGRYILEHVSNPYDVLKQAHRVLTEDGRICFQENSTLWMEFYPACPLFTHAWKKFARLQSDIGGDAMIGIKLFDRLKKVGFRNLEISIAPEVHSSDSPHFKPWISNLIGNLSSGEHQLVEKGLLTQSEFQNAVDELHEFTSHPYASTYFAWNRIEGVK
ncbi:MAG: methyltransferase domain-containing protein [Saprospiraceae bacterium]